MLARDFLISHSPICSILLSATLCILPLMPDLSSHFPLKKSRTHEVCGANAPSFAFAAAGQMGGTIMWVSEKWQAEGINPAGFSHYVDPQDFLTSKVKNQDEGLAIAEESLRSGAISLTVIELTKSYSFVAGRRLQLAAEMGKSTGLCIIPEGLGNNAAESRWRCTPLYDPQDSTLQRWEIIKNKSGTLCAWDVKWNAETHRINVVREIAQRTGSARTSG